MHPGTVADTEGEGGGVAYVVHAGVVDLAVEGGEGFHRPLHAVTVAGPDRLRAGEEQRALLLQRAVELGVAHAGLLPHEDLLEDRLVVEVEGHAQALVHHQHVGDAALKRSGDACLRKIVRKRPDRESVSILRRRTPSPAASSQPRAVRHCCTRTARG